ncbi:50S ribosomal protein L25 [Succinimonas sp.]|uniref:50S ribosomal protein L25 n=1 Tax=Succinimonas sp. TaxID=1936151 RepID=UPI00386410ED
MAETNKFTAEVRNVFGKGASRRLRRANRLPAIIYGGNEAPVSISLEYIPVFTAQQSPAFYADPIVLTIDGKEVTVKPVAIQRHPVNGALIHIDFMRA